MNKDFVLQKARNFRSFLSQFCITPETKSLIGQFAESEFESIVKMHLVPLHMLGSLQVAQEKICSELHITDEEHKKKVLLYLVCFCDLIHLFDETIGVEQH